MFCAEQVMNCQTSVFTLFSLTSRLWLWFAASSIPATDCTRRSANGLRPSRIALCSRQVSESTVMKMSAVWSLRKVRACALFFPALGLPAQLNSTRGSWCSSHQVLTSV